MKICALSGAIFLPIQGNAYTHMHVRTPVFSLHGYARYKKKKSRSEGKIRLLFSQI